MTLQDLHQWVTENPALSQSIAISWKVANNPRGIYDLIQKNYPKELEQMQQGFESTEYNVARMTDFLLKKAGESINSEAYVKSVIEAVPYDPRSVNNWTIINQN